MKLPSAILSSVCLVFIFLFLFSVDDLVSDWQKLHPKITDGLINPAFYFTITVISASFLRTWRWRLVLKQRGSADFFNWFQAYNLFFFLGSITPLKSGELLKTKWLNSQGIQYSSGIAAFLVERTLDAIGIALVGLASSIFLISYHDDGHSIFIVALTVFCLLGLFATALQKGALRIVAKCALGQKLKLIRCVGKNMLTLNSVIVVGISFPVFGLTILIWALHLIGFTAMVSFFAPQLTPGATGLILFAVNLGHLLSALPAGIGAYELSGAIVFKLLGKSFEEGLIITTLIHVFSFTVFFALAFFGLPATLRRMMRVDNN